MKDQQRQNMWEDFIRFRKRGTINVGGARMALLDIAGGFYSIRTILRDDLGVVEKELMYRAGIEGAGSFLASALDSEILRADADGFRASLDAYSSAGFGDFKVTEVEWDRSWAIVTCKDTFEGWAYARNHNIRDTVVCDYSRGVLAGFMRHLRMQNDVDASSVTCIEEDCIGKGDGTCRFIIGTLNDLESKGYSVPPSQPTIREQLEMLRRRIDRQNLSLPEVYSFEGLIGKSHGMRVIYDLIARVSDSDATVLIQGESGTGKDMVARTIHYSSGRSGRPFIAVDCTSFSTPALETELFGSSSESPLSTNGCFRVASGGTIFLNEVSRIPLSIQAMLASLLRKESIQLKNGPTMTLDNVRIISATRADLAKSVSEGKFDADLFALLNGVSIVLPPLRERIADLPLLAQHFLDMYGGQGKKGPTFSREALAALMDHDWPGNVRELEKVIEQASLIREGDSISVADLRLPEKPTAQPMMVADIIGGGTLKDERDQLERRVIIDALEKHRWRRGETARHLKITRATLYNKMRKYDLLDR